MVPVFFGIGLKPVKLEVISLLTVLLTLPQIKPINLFFHYSLRQHLGLLLERVYHHPLPRVLKTLFTHGHFTLLFLPLSLINLQRHLLIRYARTAILSASVSGHSGRRRGRTSVFHYALGRSFIIEHAMILLLNLFLWHECIEVLH